MVHQDTCEVAAVCRKQARKVASGEPGPYALTPKLLEKMLGPQRFHHEGEQEKSECGMYIEERDGGLFGFECKWSYEQRVKPSK